MQYCALLFWVHFIIEGAHIHIFGFTNRENNQFQKKLMRQNLNIWIWAPSITDLPRSLGWDAFCVAVHRLWDNGSLLSESSPCWWISSSFISLRMKYLHLLRQFLTDILQTNSWISLRTLVDISLKNLVPNVMELQLGARATACQFNSRHRRTF